MHTPDGGARITADYASLTRLAASLRALSDVLSDPNATLPMFGVEPEIAVAVDSAEHDWHAQRGRVTTFLTTTAAGVDSAAQSYRQTDLDIARASTPGKRGGRG